jgi:hypothetical protein
LDDPARLTTSAARNPRGVIENDRSIFIMHFDVAPIVIWIFELPLDQEIRAVRVIRILLGLERGLVVVAIAEDRSGYVVGVKVNDSPQLHSRFKKAYCDPG